ncbi:MAG: hypothetical protein HOV68_25420 [Streptomycetaceae bacterium]|nr:hypothetical protein [Streptomycetaceae bacterium]
MSKSAVLASAVAFTLALGGCSDDGDAPDKPGPGGASNGTAGSGTTSGSAAPKGPAYTGPALPGLTAKPLWSAASTDGSGGAVDTATGTVTGGEAKPWIVGNTVALVRTELAANAPKATTAPGGNTVVGDWNTVEFRDAASGAVRASVNLRGSVTAGTWAGKPVLYAVSTEQTASDGLSTAKRTTVWRALDENGREAGKVALPQDSDVGTTQSVVDGWVVRTSHDGSEATVTVLPADGSSPGATVKQNIGDFDGGKDRQVFGGLLFSYDKPDKDDVKHLVATDIATGQRRWTTATVRRPDGTPEASTTNGHAPEIVRAVGGDKIVIAWDAGKKSTFSSATQWGLYEVATGNLVATGPRIGSGDYRSIVDPEESLMLIASDTGSDVRSTAWDLKTGQIVWRQPKEGELPIEPFVVVNGALYASKSGYSPSGSMNGNHRSATNPLVLNVRTKAVVLPDGVSGDLFPQMTTDGHGVVTTKDGVFVFGSQPLR